MLERFRIPNTGKKAQFLKNTFSEQCSFSENYFLTNYILKLYVFFDYCREHGPPLLFPFKVYSTTTLGVSPTLGYFLIIKINVVAG
jgi:hypothetical protein